MLARSSSGGDSPVPNHLAERLDYEEKSLLASLDQLLGDQWVAGAAYRWSQAHLRNTWSTSLPTIVTGFEDLGDEIPSPNTTQRRVLIFFCNFHIPESILMND